MLQTENLLLRPPTGDDAESLFAIYGDPLTNRFNPSGPFPDPGVARSVLAGWIEHWQAHGFGPWAVATLRAPSRVIGYGGIAFRKYTDETRLNLGFRFSVESWGRGHATELGRAALGHAFADLRQPEVFALVRPANSASIRVLEKLGMALAGHLDDVPGEPHSLVYRATRPDGRGATIPSSEAAPQPG